MDDPDGQWVRPLLVRPSDGSGAGSAVARITASW
jgi:hypothetical protein